MPENHAFDSVEIEETLRHLERLLVDPVDAVRTLYTEDAIILAGGPPVRGREELLARQGVLPLQDAVISPESIIGEPGLASVFGHFSCRIEDPEAGRVDVSCHFLMVLRREPDGVWRVAREFLVDSASDGTDG